MLGNSSLHPQYIQQMMERSAKSTATSQEGTDTSRSRHEGSLADRSQFVKDESGSSSSSQPSVHFSSHHVSRKRPEESYHNDSSSSSAPIYQQPPVATHPASFLQLQPVERSSEENGGQEDPYQNVHNDNYQVYKKIKVEVDPDK
jgi:hypothetical protein